MGKMARACVCILGLLLSVPPSVGAQFTSSGPSLTTEPHWPQADQLVTVKLVGLSSVGTTITWIIDGVVESAAHNQRQVTTQAPALGETIVVDATVTNSDGTVVTIRETVTPRTVDIIATADTLTPYFYAGRSVPTVGSTLYLTASLQTGADTTPENYSYRWTVDGIVLGGGARRGQQTVSLTVPSTMKLPVSVVVLDDDGTILASQQQELPVAQAELKFYEQNPLRGITARLLTQETIITGEEMTVQAVPYFMNNDIFPSPAVIRWIVNGRSISTPDLNPLQLTLQKTEAALRNTISLSIIHPEALTQQASGQFFIR